MEAKLKKSRVKAAKAPKPIRKDTVPPTVPVTVSFDGGDGVVISVGDLDENVEELEVKWRDASVYGPEEPGQAGQTHIEGHYEVDGEHSLVVRLKREGCIGFERYGSIFVGAHYATVPYKLPRITTPC